jgi:hypothetical protein
VHVVNSLNLPEPSEASLLAHNEGDFQMKAKQNNFGFIMTLVFVSIILGLLCTFLFSIFVPETFGEILPIGFWFGPVMGLVMGIQRFTAGKVIEIKLPIENAEDFPLKVEEAMEKIGYKLESETGVTSKWRSSGNMNHTAMDALILSNIVIEIQDSSATISGPKVVVNKLSEIVATQEAQEGIFSKLEQ